MRYFTSDFHLDENRLGHNGIPNVFYRNFSSTKTNNNYYLSLIKKMSPGDELVYLGDLSILPKQSEAVSMFFFILKEMKIKSTLIVGNYDVDKTYLNLFDKCYEETILPIGDQTAYLNHYPSKAKNQVVADFSIVGHVHGAWRFQKYNGRPIINVGVDAWNQQLVSEDTLIFAVNACNKFYDHDYFLNNDR